LDTLLRTAIAECRLIECEYDGHPRIAEPHIYGSNDGERQVLVYQIGGTSSSGGLPDWRRLDLSRVTRLRLLEGTFGGPRPTKTGKHPGWDRIFAVVR
jgi:hypothetical protein